MPTELNRETKLNYEYDKAVQTKVGDIVSIHEQRLPDGTTTREVGTVVDQAAGDVEFVKTEL